MWSALACLGFCASSAAAQYSASATTTRDAFDSIRSEAATSKEQADRNGSANLGDALEQAPGVLVQRTSSISAAPIVRGLTGNRVLLVLDELRVSDSLTRAGGNALLNLIDPESVERVEVVRGPASVVYGSDALGGVVRVVTRRTAAAPGAAASTDASAYLRGASAERAASVQLGVGAALGPVGVRVGGAYGQAGELQRGGALGGQPFTGHTNWTFSSRFEAAPLRGQRIWLSHQSGHILDAPRSDLSVPEDVRTTQATHRDSAVLGYAGAFPQHSLRLRAHLGMSVRRELRRRLRVDRIDDQRDRVLAYQLGVNATLNPWELASLEVGIEALAEDVASSTTTARDQRITRSRGRYVDDSRYRTLALYSLLSQPLGADWALLIGGRLTAVQAAAPTDVVADGTAAGQRLDRRLLGFVGSLGIRHELDAHVSLMANVLGGFRAPNLEDFQALGGGARGFTIPNPGLDEERSWTLETGLKVRREGWAVDAYVWASRLQGLIVRVPAQLQGQTIFEGEPVLQRRNAREALLLGSELSLSHRFEFGLSAGVSGWGSWGRTRRPAHGGGTLLEPADKIPGPTGALVLGFEPQGGAYWMRAQLMGQLPQRRLSENDRHDVRICERGPASCERVAGYFDVSLRAGVALWAGLRLSVALENLFDRGYKTFASGAYAPGRNLVVAVRGTLGPE